MDAFLKPHTSSTLPTTVHDSNYVQQICLVSTFLVLAILAVVLRFWARMIKKLPFELSDYLIALGLIVTLGNSALELYGCVSSLMSLMQGRQDIGKSMVWGAKVEIIGPLVWVLSVTTIRASIIVLYIRLFAIRTFRLACYAVLAINFAFCLSTVLAECLICRPVSYRWDPSIQGGACGHLQSLDIYIGVFNLLLDICLVLMPMPILWGLKMSTSRKLALSGIFAMGIVVCAITLYRIYTAHKVSEGHDNPEYRAIGTLASLEALLGIINACLPLLRPAFDKMFCCASRERSNGAKENNKGDKITPSGGIPIWLRVSHIWSKSLPRYTSGDDKDLSPKARDGKSPVFAGARNLLDPKADRILGIKVPEIHVREDVDIESSLCADQATVKEQASGNHNHW